MRRRRVEQVHTFITEATPGKPGEVLAIQGQSEDTREYMPITPHYAGNITSAEREALVTEHDGLVRSLPGLEWTQRVRAEARIREIERLLEGDRVDAEVARRTVEREGERRRELGQHEAHNASVAALNALPMSQQTELIQAAIAEMRNAGAA